MTSFRSMLSLYLWLLPLSAVVMFMLVFAFPFTAAHQTELTEARFGWPLAWITQDLSRYQPIGFPATMEYTLTRAWDNPISTHYNAVAAIVNTLLVGLVVTPLFWAAMIPLRRVAENRRAAGSTPAA
ncbi:MAG: hypothetical protein ACTJHU_07115 [Mycetocola sp.]